MVMVIAPHRNLQQQSRRPARAEEPAAETAAVQSQAPTA